MPIFTRTFQIVAGILSVPVIGVSIIGAAYASPFLTHLVDIVNGSQTTVVISSNAPNWGIGQPLPTVQGVSITGSGSGTLASSTPFSVSISALNGNGTTTPSDIVSTTTDQTGSNSFVVKWNAVPGATGYIVQIATGTLSTTAGFSQYLNASTSNQYTVSTTTSTLTGSYTRLDTTAFSTLFNPAGTSYIDGANGTGTTTVAASTTALQINGNLVTQSNGTTTNCFAATAGSIFYNTANSHEWGCNGTTWTKIF